MAKTYDFIEDRSEEDKEFEEFMAKTVPIEYQSPFLKIPCPFLRSNVFTRWITESKAQSWLRLYSFIIRAKMNNKIAAFLYDKYYIGKHKLVARFTQDGLAQSLEYKDRRGVNNHLVKLEKEGVIKIIPEKWNNRYIRVYDFGTWSEVDNSKIERLYFNSVMRKKIGELKLKELEN